MSSPIAEAKYHAWIDLSPAVITTLQPLNLHKHYQQHINDTDTNTHTHTQPSIATLCHSIDNQQLLKDIPRCTVPNQVMIYTIRRTENDTDVSTIRIYPLVIQFLHTDVENTPYNPQPIQELLYEQQSVNSNPYHLETSSTSHQIQTLITAMLYKHRYDIRIEFNQMILLPGKQRLSYDSLSMIQERIQPIIATLRESEAIDIYTGGIVIDSYLTYCGIIIDEDFVKSKCYEYRVLKEKQIQWDNDMIVTKNEDDDDAKQ
jgi:hypothetical protein